MNTHAITKFSKALSGYKTQVRGMIKDGATSAEIREHYPKITEEDLDVFLANEELEATKKSREWG